MRDLFSHCTCVGMYVRPQHICTYVSVTLRNVNLHSRAYVHTWNTCVMCTDVQGCLAMEDREQWRFLTMEDVEDSTAGPLQCMCFAELSAERS